MKPSLQDPRRRWLDLLVIRFVNAHFLEFVLLVETLCVLIRDLHMQVYTVDVLTRGGGVQNMLQGLSADSQMAVWLKRA